MALADKENWIKALAKRLGRPGTEKRGEGEPAPRPELGQYGVTGDARFVAHIQDHALDGRKEKWMQAHRLDKVHYSDYDRVRYYPTVRDAIAAILLPLIRANFHFECSKQDAADLAMQDVGPLIRTLIEGLAKGGISFGRQTAEKVYELKTNVKVSATQSETGPTVKVYPFIWSLKKFAFFSPDDTELLVWPSSGEFAGIRQFVGGVKKRDIQAAKLVHYVHDQEFDSNYGVARTKGAIPFVDLATGVYDDASIYFARFAVPTLIGYAPNMKREIGTDPNTGKALTQDSLKWMARALSAVRNAHALVFPTEYDLTGNPKWKVEPLEIGERGMYVEYVNHLNIMIAASLMVPQMVLSTVPDSGTYNLGESQIDLFTQNEEALLDGLRDVINRQLLDEYRIVNFGHDCPPLKIVFEPVSTDVTQALLQGLVQNLVMGAPMFTEDGQQLGVDWTKLAMDKGVPIIMTPAGMGYAPGRGGPPMGGEQGGPPMSPGMPDMNAQKPGERPPGGTSSGEEEGDPDHTMLDQKVSMSDMVSVRSLAADALEALLK